MKKVLQSFGNLLLVFCISFTACDRDDQDPFKVSNEVKKAIYESMQDWYFWDSELPATFQLSDFSTNQDVLDGLIFKPLDRWSYLTTKSEFQNAFTGQVSGAHGFGWAFDEEENLFISFVYEAGPAGKAGWKRGWQILEINGKPISTYKSAAGGYNFTLGANEVGVTNSFKLKLPDGSQIEQTISKGAFQTNSVLNQSVIDLDGHKIGYWVYHSFKATTGLTPTRSTEVEESMTFFEQQGIQDLIIDLRYNGGGSVAVAEQILNAIVPTSANGKVMYTNKHNGSNSSRNRTVNFNKTNNINLNRLIVITSRGTASASELLINCLSPYMDVILIGDKTYGKPVGSFPLSNFNTILRQNDVELVPITFATANADGIADYFDGFPVNFEVGDDPAKDWGNLEERRLKLSLEYIQNGNTGSRIVNAFFRPKWEMIDAFEGLQKEFPLY